MAKPYIARPAPITAGGAPGDSHPLVTGKKIVYVSPNCTDRIKGLPRQKATRCWPSLFARFQRPEFQARLRWEENTVAVWDNRATALRGNRLR